MKILIVYKMVTYGKNIVYGLCPYYKKSIDSIFNLLKPHDSQVDIIFLNRHQNRRKCIGPDWWREMMRLYSWVLNFARREDYDYMLLVDPDTILPRNALIKLIDTKGDIVGALVPERPSKGIHGWAIIQPWNKNIEAQDKILKQKPFHVTGCGGNACVLLNKKAIQKDLFIPIFNYRHSVDFALWENGRRNKLRVICNPNIKCKHIEPDGTIIEGPK